MKFSQKTFKLITLLLIALLVLSACRRSDEEGVADPVQEGEVPAQNDGGDTGQDAGGQADGESQQQEGQAGGEAYPVDAAAGDAATSSEAYPATNGEGVNNDAATENSDAAMEGGGDTPRPADSAEGEAAATEGGDAAASDGATEGAETAGGEGEAAATDNGAAASEDNTAAAPEPVRDGPLYHLIQPGETLGVIANSYGVDAEDLRRFNLIGDPNSIVAGLAITIPSAEEMAAFEAQQQGEQAAPAAPATQRTHTVSAGETMASIAQAYGISTDSLAAANGITDVNLIYAGQQLVVPNQ